VISDRGLLFNSYSLFEFSPLWMISRSGVAAAHTRCLLGNRDKRSAPFDTHPPPYNRSISRGYFSRPWNWGWSGGDDRRPRPLGVHRFRDPYSVGIHFIPKSLITYEREQYPSYIPTKTADPDDEILVVFIIERKINGTIVTISSRILVGLIFARTFRSTSVPVDKSSNFSR